MRATSATASSTVELGTSPAHLNRGRRPNPSAIHSLYTRQEAIWTAGSASSQTYRPVVGKMHSPTMPSSRITV